MEAPDDLDPRENHRRMKAGKLYFASTSHLVAARKRCKIALGLYNAKAGNVSRRHQIELYKDLTYDETDIPRMHLTHSEEDDEEQLESFPVLAPPVMMDYGYNVQLGAYTFVDRNSTWVDTCPISVGARTLIGPNCSFYSGTRPLDPTIRNGTKGPETGQPIVIEEDCWIGGNVVVLPGVTIGKGATVGAGSVVTRDVEEYTLVTGNPAAFVKKIIVSGAEADDGAQDGERGIEALAGADTFKAVHSEEEDE